MKKKRPTKADIEARRKLRENTERTRRLAEKALANLPPSSREARERAGSNSAWLRELAEQAQAKLDARKRREA